MTRPHLTTPYEDLLDYRRSVAALYAATRAQERVPAERWERFRQGRDALFRDHAQSALSAEQRASFQGLRYFGYDPALRFALRIEPVDSQEIAEVELEHDGLLRMRRFGRVAFQIAGQAQALTLFWLLGYGGGIFLPFRDATSGTETYGGGRYLLDTIKHADLGHEDGRLILDFNFAYNPSCAYNSQWVCPLAPAENWLSVPIRAGELQYLDATPAR